MNAGSGAGLAEGGQGATGVAQWGPGGCYPPDGGAELGVSQGCWSQGTRAGLAGRSGWQRAAEVAWWAWLAPGAWLRRKEGDEVSWPHAAPPLPGISQLAPPLVTVKLLSPPAPVLPPG